MHCIKQGCLVPTSPLVFFIRFYRSAYRLKPGSLKSVKLEENKTDEEKYQELIEDAMLHKKRSPLRGFERTRFSDKYKHIKLPNTKYYERDDLPTYGSYKNYVKEAERARMKFREKSPYWKTLDYWWKNYRGEPKYINIGLPFPATKSSKKESIARRQEIMKIKNDPELEEKARKRQLQINVEEFLNDRENSPAGAVDISNVAKHFKIYSDLFGKGFFYPLVPMNITYNVSDDCDAPVFWGNEVSVSEALQAPCVEFKSDPEEMWSLILTCPDSNIESNHLEYLHWFVANIKGGDIKSGETIVDYMQPIPARGTGMHRMVFILFKQNQEIDFTKEKRQLPCLSLRDRNFLVRRIYETHQENLTPVSLRFFQTKWEPLVQDFFQDTLEMAEPVYKFSPWKVDKLAHLQQFPYKKTPEWLKRFMPKEPIYPGGGQFT